MQVLLKINKNSWHYGHWPTLFFKTLIYMIFLLVYVALVWQFKFMYCWTTFMLVAIDFQVVDFVFKTLSYTTLLLVCIALIWCFKFMYCWIATLVIILIVVAFQLSDFVFKTLIYTMLLEALQLLLALILLQTIYHFPSTPVFILKNKLY